MTENSLDQYYTKDSVADTCFRMLMEAIELKIKPDEATYLEPSAGDGAFIRAIQRNVKKPIAIAIDIEPHDDGIIRMDFFHFNTDEFPQLQSPVITIGNPPFGKRSKTAKDFFRKASEFSDIIAFIVPNQFEKWSVQKDLPSDFSLVLTESIDPKSFVFCGKEASVRCVFQVWAKKAYGFKDLRIKEAPPTSHPDFELYQYNNTVQARKYFGYDWDFCLPRQGFYDYSKNGQISKEEVGRCSFRIQYMFFKAKNETVLRRLRNMDFERLAMKNTTVPGFGKADVIRLYKETYE